MDDYGSEILQQDKCLKTDVHKSQGVLRVPLGMENVECYPQKRWLLNHIWKDEEISRHSRAKVRACSRNTGRVSVNRVPDFATI